MKNLKILLLFIICATMAGCTGGTGGGGGVGNLYGTVFNIYYAPISNATVVVDSSSTNTLSNGTYSFINLASGVKAIRITATSYTPAYRKVTFSGGTSATAGPAFLANLDSKVTTITLSGGTAFNTNGSIKMVFKPNSLNNNVVLTSVPAIAAPYDAPGGEQFISYIVYAKPETATLTPSAEISLPNLTGVTTQDVPFYRFNTGSLQWEPFAIGHASTETGAPIRAMTPYMGWIAAIMPIKTGTITGTIRDAALPNDPISGANVWTNNSYAVTNSSGLYTLNHVPIGKASVEASAVSYQPKTTSGVTVTSEMTTYQDISLTAIPQGNVSGTVRDNTPGYVENARIVDSYSGRTAYSDLYGRYTIYNLPAGTSTNITAYSTNHISSTEYNIIPPQAGVDFNLPFIGAGGVKTHTFSFEVGNDGFSATGFWHNQNTTDPSSWNFPARLTDYFSVPQLSDPLNQKQKVFLPDDGQIPLAHGGTHYFWFGNALPATVEASYIGIQYFLDTEEASGGESMIDNNMGTLESPVLDLAGYAYGKFSFWTLWEVEGKNPATGYDKMQVLIKRNGDPSWTSLGYLNPYADPASNEASSGQPYSSGGLNLPGTWVSHSFDISSYAGSNIKVGFFFNTVDKHYNGFRGWFIDDVKISNEQFGISSAGRIRPYIIRLPRN